ncbi:transposase (plasmid) [Escherichia coli]|nr:transposase [Escherichia coli]
MEHNLDQSLLLDDVANKAGYTKWYFQRLFKKVTGVTLASYIRARRLTKAAVELRLTKKTILEIALKYQFDSQQSFTRRFKYIFKVTPSYYRRNKLWELGNDSNLLIVFYVQIMPDDLVMQLHRF